MTTLFSNLRREWRCNIISLKQLFIILAAVWLVAESIGTAIIFFKADTYVPVGVYMTFGTLCMMTFAFGFYYYSVGIELSISMSRTRKAYLPCMLIVAYAQMLCGLALLALFSFVSEGIRVLLFSQKPLEMQQSLFAFALHNIHWILLILAAALLLGLVVGAAMQRFGRKALWLLWFVYMVPMLFGSTFSRLLKTGDTTTVMGRIVNGAADFLERIHFPQLLPVGAIIIAIALLIASCYWLLHTPVRQN